MHHLHQVVAGNLISAGNLANGDQLVRSQRQIDQGAQSVVREGRQPHGSALPRLLSPGMATRSSLTLIGLLRRSPVVLRWKMARARQLRGHSSRHGLNMALKA